MMLPPELMGQGPPDMGPMAGPAPGLMAGPPPSLPPMPEDAGPPEGEDLGPLEHLRMAIEHAQAALQSEPDDTDSKELSKMISGLYAILSNRQKEEGQLLGNPRMRAMSRPDSGSY